MASSFLVVVAKLAPRKKWTLGSRLSFKTADSRDKMAFEKLSSGLQNAITTLRKVVVIDKKTVKEYIKEIQKVLLAADVNVKLVFELSKNIEERGLLEKPPGMLTKKVPA